MATEISDDLNAFTLRRYSRMSGYSMSTGNFIALCKRLCQRDFMPLKSDEKPKRPRGFAAMTLEQRLKICCLGGRKTVRRHGRKHMAKIGAAGRRKRTLRERREKRAAAVNPVMAYRGP